MSRPSQSVSIMQTGNLWHTAANNTEPALSDYSESALAAKIFEMRHAIDVVAVVDTRGKTIRTIHRNLNPSAA